MAKFVIRNSDILFGRTVATYKFAGRDDIRNAIKEISALQALGIDKRLPQLMYEKKHLSDAQIYAVMESLLQSHQIKRISPLQTYLFTDEDDERFHDYLGISRDFYRDTLELPSQIRGKELSLSPENLLLCINIKHSLARSAIEVPLLSIIYDKRLLTPHFQKIIPGLAEKKKVIVSSKKRDDKKIRESTALLFAQIAIVNKKLTEKQSRKALGIWEKVTALGVELKYSELLFYLGMIDEANLEKIAAFLAGISGIDQHPRFPLFRLNSQELGFFETVKKQNGFRPNLLQKTEVLVGKLHEEGLLSLRLPDVLILKGHLSRQKIAMKWAEIRKEEIAEKVRRLQMEGTRESNMEMEEIDQELNEDLLQSREALKNAENEIGIYYSNTQKPAKNTLEHTEARHFEKELDETFRTSQDQQRKVMKKELESFRKHLHKTDREHAKTLNTVIGHYRRAQRNLKFYFAIGIFLLFMVFLGIFFFALWDYIFFKPLEKNTDRIPKETKLEQEPDSFPHVPHSGDTENGDSPAQISVENHEHGHHEVMIEEVPATPNTEAETDIDWQQFIGLEQKRLLQRRRFYAVEVSDHCEQYDGSWHTPSLARKMAKMDQKRQRGMVLFQKRWYPKEKLGEWHEITLAKKRKKWRGFLLLKNTGKKIYVFRPFSKKRRSIKRYIKDRDIIARQKGYSPWERYFKERDAISPEDANGQYWLVRWCENKDLSRLLQFQREALLSCAPNFPVARHAMGYVWYRGRWRDKVQGLLDFHGNWMRADEAARHRLIERNNHWVLVEEAMSGDIHPSSHRFEPLKALSKKARKRWLQGRIAFVKKNYRLAGKRFDELCNDNPDFSLVWVEKAKLALVFYDTKTAYDDFSQALDLDPNLPDAYLGRGMILQKREQYDSAQNDFRKALQAASKDILPYCSLARLYLQLGREQDALDIATRAGEKVADKNAAKNLSMEIAQLVNARKNAPKSQTDHYELYGNAPELYEKAVCLWLEEIYRHYLVIYGAPRDGGRKKVRLFNERQDFCKYIRLEYPQISHNLTGMWWPVTGETVVALDQHPLILRKTLFASAAAQLLAREKNAPPWLREGTKTYFASADVAREVRWDKVPVYRLTDIKVGKAISLSRLLTQSSEIFYAAKNYQDNRLYSYGWVYFLVHAEKGKYRSLLKEYMARIRRGDSWKKAANVFSQEKLKELHAHYRIYWNNMR